MSEDSKKALTELFGVLIDDLGTPRKSPAADLEGATAEDSETLGSQSLEEGDYEGAVRHFRKAMAQRGKAASADVGGSLDVADRDAEALREFAKADRESEDREPKLGMAQIYRRYGRHRDAIAQLQEAVAREPENAFVHYKLAETYREAGFPQASLPLAQRAADLAGDDSFYAFWLADFLTELRRFEEALPVFKQALDLSPGDDHYYLRAAVAFWGAGRHAEAIRAIRLATELDPDKLAYHAILAAFLEADGKPDEAEPERATMARMDAYDRDQAQRVLAFLGLELPAEQP